MHFSWWFLVLASSNGLLAVCLGAFGAHALKDRIPENLLSAWSTAVQYHFYHLLALALVAVLLQQGHSSRLLNASGILYVLGIVLFSGSLYWLALGGPRWLGPVTPLGGVCFIGAWFCLFLALLKKGIAT